MRLRITLLSAVALGLNARKTAHPQRTRRLRRRRRASTTATRTRASAGSARRAAAARAARTTEGQVARAGVRREETDVEPAL